MDLPENTASLPDHLDEDVEVPAVYFLASCRKSEDERVLRHIVYKQLVVWVVFCLGAAWTAWLNLTAIWSAPNAGPTFWAYWLCCLFEGLTRMPRRLSDQVVYLPSRQCFVVPTGILHRASRLHRRKSLYAWLLVVSFLACLTMCLCQPFFIALLVLQVVQLTRGIYNSREFTNRLTRLARDAKDGVWQF
jgi:hypothetical protein